MPTRRKSAEAIRSQQTRFLAFFGAIAALVLLGFAAGDTKPAPLWNSFALLPFGSVVVPPLQVIKGSMRRSAHNERAAMNERETAALQVEDLTYNADGLIPCIVQDEQTREVLMMAWMNEEAVRRTTSQGTTWFWSRSRQKFWHKGEESGNTQKLVELRYDCDADTLLALVNPAGPACHTGETTCFYRSF